MAEKGAHLTGTTFTKPSIFEIVAQESLASTLDPAFKKFFDFFLSFNLDRYGHLLRWSDEAYAVFHALLQLHYLSKYSASFSETFYGLKRIPLIHSNFKTEATLSKNQKRLSLIFLVLFPYLRKKLNSLSEKYKFEELDGRVIKNKWERLYKLCIVKFHTTFFTTYDILSLYNYILYISGKSAYPTLVLRLLNVTLMYNEAQSEVSIIELLRKLKYNSFTIHDGLNIGERVLTRSIELGAFVLQFISWWNQENHHTDIMALPVPPAPTCTAEANQYKGICPVCCKKPHIHTALAVSGYVFCYQCILSAIRKNQKCPVTNYPATEDDLIRLYISE